MRPRNRSIFNISQLLHACRLVAYVAAPTLEVQTQAQGCNESDCAENMLSQNRAARAVKIPQNLYKLLLNSLTTNGLRTALSSR